jgi:Dolichyl-phosphate-mannose-protein mannosyltransferase
MELSKEMATPAFFSERVWLIAILIALLHAAMAVTAVNTKSPTFDEPQHLTAGYSYWVTNDFRLDPENGGLPARWAALPLLFGDTRFVSLNDRGWQSADEGRIARQFLYEVGNNPDRMFARARMMMSVFGLALCLLIYRIAREFFGVVGGLIAEIAAAFDPNFLGHSALVTSDVAATFFFTATIWSCWRLFHKVSPARLASAALSLSGLSLAKFSAPIVLPVIAMMSILEIFSKREIAVSFGRVQTVVMQTWKKACVITASFLIVGATVVLAVWLSFSFRYSALTDNGTCRKVWDDYWAAIRSDHTVVQNTIDYGRAHHLLPEAYLCGFAYTQKSAESRPAFLDNRWSLVGFPSFFPRAFCYKTPLPFLCLIALGFCAAIGRRESWRTSNLFNPFFLFVLLYGAFAVGTNLNIGHRHLLPVYPALFIGCGAVVHLASKNRTATLTTAVGIILFWQIGESFAIRPNYLAYFNEVAGGPSDGYKHLADSSVDWGQDLPALKTWLDNHPAIVNGKPLYLAYFGTADPRSYEINARLLPENHSSGDRAFAPLTGGIYCISATTLQSVYAREIGQWCVPYEQYYQAAAAEIRRYRDTASDPTRRVAMIANDGALNWAKKIKDFERLRFERLCAYLRHQAPAAQIGYSVFVFELTDDEVNRALYGPPAELTREVCVSGF